MQIEIPEALRVQVLTTGPEYHRYAVFLWGTIVYTQDFPAVTNKDSAIQSVKVNFSNRLKSLIALAEHVK